MQKEIHTLLKRATNKLKKAEPMISFTEDVRALYDHLMDPESPRRSKILAFAALVYFIVVLDVVPDFLGLAGYLDDAVVIAATVYKIRHAIKPHRRKRPERRPNEGQDSSHDPAGGPAPEGGELP